MNCVFCRKRTSPRDSAVAHVVPHAICGSDDLVLPRPFAHRDCDARLADLDTALLHCWPIMWHVAAVGIPSRRTGEPKHRIGDDRTSIDFTGKRFRFQTTFRIPAGRTIQAHTPFAELGHSGPEFDEWKFVRSLHKMGLLSIAYFAIQQDQLSILTDDTLDALRRYVMSPVSRKELWGYGFRTVPTKRFAEIGAGIIGDLGWTAHARLFGCEFLISSRNAIADVIRWAETNTTSREGRYELVESLGRWSKTRVLV